MSSNDFAIRVENLSKRYEIYANPRDRLKQLVLARMQQLAGQVPKQYFQDFWALKDVSFEVKKGETVGIVGRNGSGKSTLLQMICGTLSPTKGTIQTNGRIAALLELGSGFNPEFTGRENVYLNGAVLGLTNEEIDQRFDDIATFADIEGFIEQPVKTYSSGMMVRLAFAVAINVGPEILVVDEALAVGDAAFQRKCMRRINELSAGGVTLLFVSHDTETVKKICTEALYLNRGVMHELGPAKDVCISYERDLFGAGKAAMVSDCTEKTADHSAARSTLDPALLNTSEKVYGDGRAQIHAISITNTHGEHVNVLEPGVEVIVSYRANFLNSSARPIFGMMINNREGVCIFGTNTEGHSLSSRIYSVGDEVKIEFHLRNNLGPGVYYLTCGIHSSNDGSDLVYLHRRMDTLIFKCVIPGSSRISGTANLYSGIQFDIKEMVSDK